MYLRRLVEQCQTGDREAFGVLYQTYLIPMRRVVAHYVHSPEAAWDILHEGFLIAFDSINSLRDPSKVEAWLTSIMKNLALQYLKKESTRLSVPFSDTDIDNNSNIDNPQPSELSWDELNRIIDRLPEGYGKVFRLAILDGLSHKEIGSLLGIAPHSSSSQLAHAKAKMRLMITRYRAELAALSIITIILLLWQGLFKERDYPMQNPTIISKQQNEAPQTISGTVETKERHQDTIIPKMKEIYKALCSNSHDNIANETITNNDIQEISENDSTTNDSVPLLPLIFERNEFIAKEDLPLTQSVEDHDWSLSLAYSGNLGQDNMNRFQIPGANDPNSNTPDEIEVTEKTRHYMPLVIGLSLNKSLATRWSVESGIRYTFLRSDTHSESNLMNKETIQRIHYIGIPLKFNYRIFTYNGFSLYGQGGGALDIPVYGKQSIWETSPQSQSDTKIEALRIHAPMQWSVEGGLGIQYHFTPSFSIYAEPSFRYYFKPDSEIKTIRQDKPFEFTIPIGLRVTW